MSSPSILSTAEYYKLSLIAAGVDLADIPPILDTATWRHMMLAALYQISSGGGGGGYIDGVVDTYNDLPVTVGTPALNTVYLVRFGSGVWLINRHPAGLYIRIANNGTLADWEYLGTFPEVQSDLRWRVYNETDPTKEVALDVSNVTTGTLRTLGVPNASGRIQIEGQPIGDVSPSSGAFTTLSATGTATLPHIHGALAGNLYIHVKNVSGVQLSRGTPVYVVGNVGATDRVEVAAADFDDPTKMPAVGLLKQTLANNADGDAVIVGELDDTNTSLYTLNQELFVGNNGAITGTRPTSGQIQSVGTVARVQSSTGVIVVNMQGTEFAFQSPPAIGSVTPNAATFTNLVANTELQLPTNAPASPSAGDIYRSADQIRYRDSTGTTERILLNNLDNLSNLGNTATARTNIGLGSADSVTFGSLQNTPIGSTTRNSGAFTTLNATNGTITASAPVLDLAQTWNNAAVTFTGLRFNLTPTAYDHRSLIFSLEESSTPFFGIQSIIGVPPTQAVRIFGGSRGLRFGARQTGATGAIDFCAMRYQTNVFSILHGVEFGWSSQPYDSGNDLALHRDAADTLAQRRAANPQAFRLYSTFSSTTNFERLNLIAQTGGNFIIGTEKGSGGGLARALELQTDGVTRLTVAAAGTVSTSGNFSCVDLTCGTLTVSSGSVTAAATGALRWNGRARLNSPADSIITVVNAANTDFDRLQFGGTTSSFPALKRSSTSLQVRLADDTAYSVLDAQLRAQGTAPATSGATGTAGDIRYDADYIYVCTAANTWKRAAIATW